MIYVSIDIETSGLNHDMNHVLSIGAIIEDTNKKLPYEELPKFNAIVLQNNIQGSPRAVTMNQEIISLMGDYLEGTDEVRKLLNSNSGYEFYEEEDVVNRTLIRFCEKHNVKYFAANSNYYADKEQSEAQDALMCVKEGEYVSKPSKYIGKRGRDFRFGFPNNSFYIKSPEEMHLLFRDLPEALSTTLEIEQKCETYKLAREVLLPKFDIPLEYSPSILC